MRVAFIIMFVSIAANFATGIMMTAIPDYFDGGVGFAENTNYTYAFENADQTNIDPSSQVESSGGFLNRIIDTYQIGYMTKLTTNMWNFLFGFWNMLEAVFKPMLGDDMDGKIFGAIRILTSISYILGLLWLFSGRNVANESL